MMVETWESQEVLGLWVLEKVSEMQRNHFEQCVNLTVLLGLIGLNFPFVCNFLLNTLHLIDRYLFC